MTKTNLKSRSERQKVFMIRVAFSQAFRLYSKINKWQKVRHLKFQHGLPHIGLQHVVIGANAGAGVISVVQGALGKKAEKGSIMEAPSPHLGDHKLIPWPYSDPSIDLTLQVCIPQPSFQLIWHKILNSL